MTLSQAVAPRALAKYCHSTTHANLVDAEEVTEKVADKVAEEVKEEVTEEVTEKVTEKSQRRSCKLELDILAGASVT